MASAAASCVPSASTVSSRPFEKPRNRRERITPELPLAPRSMAEAAVFATLAVVSLSASACMASLPAPIVMDIFVPVSPSGTGKMLRSSTNFRFFNMLFAPEMTASRSCLPVITAYTSCLKTFGRRKNRLPIDICMYFQTTLYHSLREKTRVIPHRNHV